MTLLRRLWAQLRVRLILTFAVIALTTYLIFGASLYQSLALELPRAKQEELDREIEIERLRLEQRLDSGEDITAIAQEALMEIRRGFEVGIYDIQGQSLVSTASVSIDSTTLDLVLSGQEIHTTTQSSAGSDRCLVGLVPLRHDNAIVGALQIASSLREVDRLLNYVAPRLYIGVTLSLIAIIGAGLYLGGNITRILHEIEQTAQEIAQGRFDKRIEITTHDEVGRLGQTINYMASELQALSKVRTEFLSKVSHELRTPLTTIKLVTATLLRRRKLPDQERPLQIIDQQTDHLTRLVSDLLELSRLDTGRLDLQMASVDLVALATDVLERLQLHAQNKDIDLSFDTQVTSVFVRVDQQRMMQILDNLIDNALKHTALGGSIEVRVDQVGNTAELQVRDTGMGISKESLPRIFERFYQADPQRTTGAGLGLAVVKELVEAHGGTISVESTIGVGSTFTIVLPISE